MNRSEYRHVDFFSEIPSRPIWSLGSGTQSLKIYDRDGRLVCYGNNCPDSISVFDNGDVALEVVADDSELLARTLNFPLTIFANNGGESTKSLLRQSRRHLMITNYYWSIFSSSWELSEIYAIAN